ncbi:hypothetical protein ILUMI_14705 [Ignelater luminosus]|uniref:Uncharacterized protein n=1 Tax=Ignelater luminosus TaxID=2038154 RepID=A0A8K0CVH9_IGNLU|nr:hypothetical protein ILUMI_14705 [Ignelater luminosus]
MTHTPTTAKAVGRPAKRFSESSDVTKRRRIHTLLEKSAEELSFATQVTLRARGLRTAAEMVKRVSECPENAQQLKKAITQSKKSPIKLTSDEASASFVQKKLTKNQYVAIHTETKIHNADIYPTYAELLLAKKRRYPENISVTEVSAEIVLQSLLHHTVRRIMITQKDVLRVCASSGNSVNVRAIYKWGCDGAAGQQNYKLCRQ